MEVGQYVLAWNRGVFRRMQCTRGGTGSASPAAPRRRTPVLLQVSSVDIWDGVFL